MLPPFRIKGIVGHPLHRRRRSRNDDGLESDSASILSPDNQHRAEFEVQGDGVVQVTAKEYDRTIEEIPEARLQYQDEDDGETVIVGSSLELSQLIGELLPNSYRLPLSTLNAENDPVMHTFEIQQTLPVVDVWRNFRLRTVTNSISGQPSCQLIPPSTGSRSNASYRLKTAPLDPRSTTNKPSVVKADTQNESAPSGQHESFLGAVANMGSNKQYPPMKDTSSGIWNGPNHDTELEPFGEGASTESKFITEEGKKQAYAAGKRMREIYKAYWRGSYRPELEEGHTTGTSGDFWSTYKPTHQFSGPSPSRREREPDSPESPIEPSPKRLLSEFEAELSRLMAQNSGLESHPKHVDEPAAAAAKESTSDSASTAVQGPEIGPSENTNAQPTSRQATEASEAISHIVTVFGKSFQSLLSRVAILTAELADRLPEVEQRVTDLHHQIPDQMQATIHESLQVMGGHIQTLAGAMQQAATSARSSSIATSEAEKVVTAQLNKLRILASDIRDIGGSLIAGVEKSLKPQDNSANKGTTDASSAPEAVNPATKDIFIGNLPPDATENSVISVLASQGFVGTVTFPRDSLTGEHAGFCYVHFPSTYAAGAALQALRGNLIGDYTINVEPANEHSFPGSNDAAESSGTGIQHPTPELPPLTTNTRRPGYPSFVPVSELDNDTSNIVPSEQNLPTSSLCEQATIPIPEVHGNTQTQPNTALLDKSESNLAERYPPLFASQSTDNLSTRPTPPDTYHGTSLLSEPNDNDCGLSRYPSMQQLEQQHLFMRGPWPTPDWPAPRPRTTYENNINLARTGEQLAPPVPSRIPGSWPWDQDSQSSIPSRPNAHESRSEQGTSRDPNHINPPVLSDLSSPFNPQPHRASPFSASNVPGLRRSATERVRRPRPSLFGNNPHPQRPLSSHELAEISAACENPSDLPGTFPREAPTAAVMEASSNDPAELCLSQLRALGFGDDRSQDANRLRIFAEAANGDLADAIEMIEEERKAYEQRHVQF
ncbi:TPA_exp: putative RNA binding protein [Trichophyton benhamiae CBS 112371]|uniref:RNA binding protein, putative n=1 Tax=Arthroderma benhamiae (strain ATCC MYA-4681 / CBS 112371) TaxID=663331 RepID=D4AYB1_ARTBC|nr:RNA binding protein, putative [Trichophyton benhamiae CBS 112371]EFE31927.1 RNA binding protein, putative [Trichophyton benhamiae CBS 112371]DAA75039.1 TPA_exp: putative RNA binding protein [Trichophyton benhamiae CBS 112371]